MRIAGLGLQPTDPCYDANRPWYVPNFWNSDAECACIAANPGNYTPGEQCVTLTPSGIAQGVGTAVGQGASLVGNVGGSILGGIGAGAADTLNLSGLLLIAGGGLLLFALLSKR